MSKSILFHNPAVARDSKRAWQRGPPPSSPQNSYHVSTNYYPHHKDEKIYQKLHKNELFKKWCLPYEFALHILGKQKPTTCAGAAFYGKRASQSSLLHGRAQPAIWLNLHLQPGCILAAIQESKAFRRTNDDKKTQKKLIVKYSFNALMAYEVMIMSLSHETVDVKTMSSFAVGNTKRIED